MVVGGLAPKNSELKSEVLFCIAEGGLWVVSRGQVPSRLPSPGQIGFKNGRYVLTHTHTHTHAALILCLYSWFDRDRTWFWPYFNNNYGRTPNYSPSEMSRLKILLKVIFLFIHVFKYADENDLKVHKMHDQLSNRLSIALIFLFHSAVKWLTTL